MPQTLYLVPFSGKDSLRVVLPKKAILFSDMAIGVKHRHLRAEKMKERAITIRSVLSLKPSRSGVYVSSPENLSAIRKYLSGKGSSLEVETLELRSPTSDRSTSDRPTSDRPTSDRPTSDRPTSDRPTSDRSTSSRLEVLYRDWTISQAILKAIGRLGPDEKELRHHGKKVLELAILDAFNSPEMLEAREDAKVWTEAEEVRDRSLVWRIIRLKVWPSIVEGFLRSFKSRTGHDYSEVGLEELVERLLLSPIDPSPPVEVSGEKGGELRCGKFHQSLTRRTETLLRIGGPENTACTLLFYDALFPGGQQLTYTKSMDTVREYGIDTEAFASPLNSHQIAIREGRDWAKGAIEGRFCSISKAVDEPFGSIGDFLTSPLLRGRHGVEVNPPYTELILEKAAERAIELLEKGWVEVVSYIGPDWSDASFARLLHRSPFLVSERRVSWEEMGAYGFDNDEWIKIDMYIFHFILRRPPS